MIMTDKTKRSFFKKAAVAVGFVAAVNYLSKLFIVRSSSIHAINDKSANDVKKQNNAWLKKQFAPMTDKDKKQMLDQILDSHKNNHA